MEAGGNQYDAADPKHQAHGNPNGYYRTWPVDEPLKTLHTQETKALCVPVGGTWNDDARPVEEPHRTTTTRETTALVVPLEGRAGDRCSSDAQPLRTQTSRHLDALVTMPFVLDNNHSNRGRRVDESLPTLTTATTKGLVEPPFIAELRGGGSTARPVDHPAATFTASGNHHALITSYYGSGLSGSTTGHPMPTVTTRDRHALIMRNNSSAGDGAEMLTPAGEVLRTLTTTGHQSLVTPGDIDAAAAQVDDCMFRMLEPHEVAAGMAFPADYIWEGTRRERVKLAGNAVTPPAARDLIAVVAASLLGAA